MKYGILFLLGLLLIGSASAYSFSFGDSSGVPVIGDWDGDDIPEIATYKDNGTWYMDENGNGVWDAGTDHYFYLGGSGWVPFAGDYGGWGEDRIMTYNGDNLWAFDWDDDGWDAPPDDVVYAFGSPGCQGVPGDWNGDGVDVIGVRSGAAWYIDLSGNGEWNGVPPDYFFGFGGTAGYAHFPADWDGDGVVAAGLVKDGEWFLDLNENGAWDGAPPDAYHLFGNSATGMPYVIGDWDNDGDDDIGVFNTTSNKFNIDLDDDGVYEGGSEQVDVGASGSGYPVAGNWQSSSGADKVGLFSSGNWYMDISTPTAAFSGNVTSGCTPLTVAFTDSSTGSPDTWQWYINNDEVVDSTSQNPVYTFTSAGTYNVRLRSSLRYPGDWENKSSYITVTDAPVAAFSANPTNGLNPLDVDFTDASTGVPTNWDWYLNNDEVKDSDLQNPSYTYSSIGTYNVRLYVSNACTGDWQNYTAMISVVDNYKFPGCAGYPTDLDADGLYEDINGNSRKDWSDIIVFFTYLDWARVNEPADQFDWNGNTIIDFDDVYDLYEEGV